jgi:hypothetical protein
VLPSGDGGYIKTVAYFFPSSLILDLLIIFLPLRVDVTWSYSQ